MLGALVATPKQDDDDVSALSIVDTVSGTEVEAEFRNAVSNAFMIAEPAFLDMIEADLDTGSRLPISQIPARNIQSPLP
ncbi:hypothetical protein M673_23195 (plasmid) [Aureimonas sp. AU20]|nr:hypothetical protein M673_23195 [Aureimonas sp. AU20]